MSMLKMQMGGPLFIMPVPKDISILFASFAKMLAQPMYRLMMLMQVSVASTERVKVAGHH